MPTPKPSRIKALYEPVATVGDQPTFADQIRKSDSGRKTIGIASLRAKIAAARQLLEAADEMALRAGQAAQIEGNQNMEEDSPDLYIALEGSWACLEEMINLFGLGQLICKRVAGDTPIPPIEKFARQVVEEDAKA